MHPFGCFFTNMVTRFTTSPVAIEVKFVLVCSLLFHIDTYKDNKKRGPIQVPNVK